MILGSLELSTLVLAKASAKMVIYIANQLFPLSQSHKGQLKVKQKCCLGSILLYLVDLYMITGLIVNILRLILCTFLAMLLCCDKLPQNMSVKVAF